MISLMYLIFLALAVAQIPVGWLDNNTVVKEYLYAPRTQFGETPVKTTFRKLETLKTAFTLYIHHNNKIAGNKGAYTYTLTDEYFLDLGNSHVLFRELKNLHNWILELHPSDTRRRLFQTLFENDLKKGLANNDSVLWAEYKWKHVPQYMALNLLSEMILRMQLMEIKPETSQEVNNEPALTLLDANPMMHVGDEAFFVAKGDSLREINVLRDNQKVNDFTSIGNGFVFKPSAAGTYSLHVTGNLKSEKLDIQVLPAGFSREKDAEIRVFYKGIPCIQKIPFKPQNMKIFCNQNAGAVFLNDSQVQFCPSNEGWCNLKIMQDQHLVMFDSVFVKALPEPLIKINGLSAFSVSKSRIQQGYNFQLQAFHPSFNEGTFTIISYNCRKVGLNTQTISSNSNTLSIKAEEAGGLSYLIFYDITVKAGKENILIKQPVILQVL